MEQIMINTYPAGVANKLGQDVMVQRLNSLNRFDDCLVVDLDDGDKYFVHPQSLPQRSAEEILNFIQEKHLHIVLAWNALTQIAISQQVVLEKNRQNRLTQTESINISVAAHISAASEVGPRYDQSLSSDERQSIGNGIWLCQSCAKLIDSDCRMYSVNVLNKWKNKAEEIARNALEGIAGFDSTHPSKNHLLFKNGSEFDSWHKDVNLQ